MGRLKVTPKGKVKKNVPITRIGKKQYKKRRFAAQRKIDQVTKANPMSDSLKAKSTAEQAYTRLNINVHPSASKEERLRRKKKLREDLKGDKLPDPEPERGNVGQPVSEHEATTIANLVLKYGKDYKRMSLDAELNPWQLNPKQLQRRVVNYMKWEKAAMGDDPRYAALGDQVKEFGDPALRHARRGAAPRRLD